ncbi:DUF2982 domain-containing protein [Shewanella sp. 10N.261.52.F9]|uniref:DUF2982 domain-containing protein n=1 Tax=Shewanella TaxID=22 RepID=UPI00200E74F3|nr:DUF2982 domain-containing protein [Shewanella marinintestina]MCL1145175.1 DUF2982 domain-containing protein [Shewanella marinintestina]
MKEKEILIEPISKRNGITLSVVGVIGLIVGIGFFVVGSQFFAPGILCFALGAISTVLGISKLVEPAITIRLTDKGITHFHRRGEVFIAWNNIQRFDQPRVTQGLETIDLPYIGIKLKSLSPVLEAISLRLATGLLTEQRPLLMTASTQEEDLSTLENQMSEEFTPFIEGNDRFKGVLAMFGHRSRLLDANLGYHLYISTDCLDRPADEFIKLLRELQQQSL